MFYLQPQKANRLTKLRDEVCLSACLLISTPLKYCRQRFFLPAHTLTTLLILPFNTFKHPLSCRVYQNVWTTKSKGILIQITATLAQVTSTKLTLQASLHELKSLVLSFYQMHLKRANKQFTSNSNGNENNSTTDNIKYYTFIYIF